MEFEGLTNEQVARLARYISSVASKLHKRDAWGKNEYEDLTQTGWEIAWKYRAKFNEEPFGKALSYIGAALGNAAATSEGYLPHGMHKVYARPFGTLPQSGSFSKSYSFEQQIEAQEPGDEWNARRELLGAFLVEYCERTTPKRSGRCQRVVARAWLENLDVNEFIEKYGFSCSSYYGVKNKLVKKLRQEVGEGATIRGLRDFLRDKKYEADRKCKELRQKHRGGLGRASKEGWQFMNAANAYEENWGL